MENYYSVDYRQNGTWSVMNHTTVVIIGLQSANLANIIADSLNSAYAEGQRFAEERITGKIINFITK